MQLTISAGIELTTDTWAGTWSCKDPRYPAITLTIVGKGKESSITSEDPGPPSSTVYTIDKPSLTVKYAKGTYLCQMLVGLWPGTWEIKVSGDTL